MNYNFDEKDLLMQHVWNPLWATVRYGVIGWLQVVQKNCLWAGDMEEMRLVVQIVDGLQAFPDMRSRQLKTVREGVEWYRWYERQCEYQEQLSMGSSETDSNGMEAQGVIRDLDVEYMAE